jgi:hypothetical protein
MNNRAKSLNIGDLIEVKYNKDSSFAYITKIKPSQNAYGRDLTWFEAVELKTGMKGALSILDYGIKWHKLEI